MRYSCESIWSQFTERQTLPEDPPRAPHQEVSSVLGAWYAQRCDMEKSVLETEEHWVERMADLAVYNYHFEQSLAEYESVLNEQELGQVFRHLQMIKNQMTESIRQSGVVVLDPKKCKYAHISDLVDVLDWVYKKEFSQEVVTEVKDPVILYNDKAIRLGRVVMGSPQSSGKPDDVKENKSVKTDHKQGRRNGFGNDQLCGDDPGSKG